MKKQYSVLMALNGLEIGGAETHVVELSKEMQRQGYRVVVASNGGVYESELASCGIKHYKVPMNKRSLPNMIVSYFKLKKIIRKEKIDIVHAHARIPGFLCGLLKRKMNFTFVSTAHWVFDTHGGLKYLTNWGQKTVAVSDDIKDYLKTNYGVPDKNIFVTINGIDTDKFSPECDCSDFEKEFGLNENENRLVYVSRMDEDRAYAARLIINIAEKLDKKIENLRIIIAGGGNVFDELKAKADEVNKHIGRKLIIMTGARTDINKIAACGKVFVGVSRAALEAMAAEKPVILAGNEGYLGLFSEKNFDKAVDNNFCCRGCEQTSEEALLRDISYAFNDIDDEERKRLGQYGREVIFKYYSVNKMANDCIKAYKAALEEKKEKKYKVLMSGYYGFNNSGDDAILISIYSSILKTGRNIDVTVLANKPEETSKKYGVKVIYRYNIFKVIKAISDCDLLISGGGSLLQDRTSTRSLVYYLSIIKTAKILGKKVMLYANGIGPVEKQRNRNMVRHVVNKADLITLREENSLTELRKIGVKNKNAIVTADPVFAMESISDAQARKAFELSGVPTDKPIVGVSVRNWKNIDGFLYDMAKLCDRVYTELGRNIVFIPMQMPSDTAVSRKVREMMKNPSYILSETCTPSEIMGTIGLMDAVVSMRLHTLIFAANRAVPMLGFVYDPKIEYYLNLFNMPKGGSINDYDMEKAFVSIKNITENRQRYSDDLKVISSEMKKHSQDNVKYLFKLLDK